MTIVLLKMSICQNVKKSKQQEKVNVENQKEPQIQIAKKTIEEEVNKKTRKKKKHIIKNIYI